MNKVGKMENFHAPKLFVFVVLMGMLVMTILSLNSSTVYGEEIKGNVPPSTDNQTVITSSGGITNQYTVTFKDIDGTILKTEIVEEGNDATPPTVPARKGYTFKGWDNWYTNVTEDRVLTAVYELKTTTEKEESGKLAGGKTATPPKDESGGSNQNQSSNNSAGQINNTVDEETTSKDTTSGSSITGEDVIKDNETPKTTVEDKGMSPTAIVLGVLGALMAAAVAGFLIIFFLRKRKEEQEA